VTSTCSNRCLVSSTFPASCCNAYPLTQSQGLDCTTLFLSSQSTTARDGGRFVLYPISRPCYFDRPDTKDYPMGWSTAVCLFCLLFLGYHLPYSYSHNPLDRLWRPSQRSLRWQPATRMDTLQPSQSQRNHSSGRGVVPIERQSHPGMFAPLMLIGFNGY
jgi:hypothetical protein